MAKSLQTKTGKRKPSKPESLDEQLKKQRRAVDFDTFDIQIQQILIMLDEAQIWVAPAYQRQFRWQETRCSQLIESLMLGIPVPSLFMATNPNNTWEVVDGVQRLSSIVKFAGTATLRERLGVGNELKLEGLTKLTNFEGLSYNELPVALQLHFKTRPLKVVTLNDKSDKVVRYDLFERLNTGGVALSSQEIRSCIYTGDFSDKIEELADTPDFKTVLKLKTGQQRDGTAEECVLRFFAFLHQYKLFDHSVVNFLNSYMEKATKKFDIKTNEKIFRATFAELAITFPAGLKRPTRGGRTPINLYEGIAVGAALALRESPNGKLVTKEMQKWLASQELRGFTTGATNSRAAVIGRIEFCRDRFLGKAYVSTNPK